MDKFIPANRVKNLPLVKSYSVNACGHCPMDLIIEELCGFPDVNVLVMGVGECVYYAAKQPFAGGRNWGFELTDQELVFGNTAQIEEALSRIADNGMMTVCIETCIPSIMDLEPELGAVGTENCVIVKAPDYTAISPDDILSELYLQIGKKLCPHSGQDQLWEQVDSISQMQQKLTRGVHVVKNRKFLDFLRYFEGQGVTVLDQTVFHPLAYYEQNQALLGIDQREIDEMRGIVRRFAESGAVFQIKSRHAVYLANFLNQEHVCVACAVVDGADRYQYAQCAAADAGLRVSFDFSEPLPPGNNLELTADGPWGNFETLCKLLQEANEKWA